jgi:predicted Zn-dependent peptidase
MTSELPRPMVAALPNGLRVVTTQVPWARQACITLAVRVGSRDEQADQAGIAHFAEHLSFRGTAEHPSETEFMGQLGAIGAWSNATTSFDCTRFYIAVRPQHLSRALALLSSMVHQPTLNGFEVERRVVLSEHRMYAAVESNLTTDEDGLLRPIWHPSDFCRAPTVGTVKTLEALTLEHLRAFFARYYVGNNMVLSVAGPAPAAEVGAAVAPFGQLASGKFNLRSLPPPANPGAMHLRPVDTHTCELRCLFPLLVHPPQFDAAWAVLNHLLQGSGHGALHRALRSTRGLVYSCQSSFGFYSDFGTHTVSLDPNPSDPITPFSVLVNTLAAFKRRPPGAAELAGAKEGLLHQQASSAESVWNHSTEPAWAMLNEWPYDLDADASRLRAVTADDVHALAQQLFKTGAGHLVYAGPSSHEKSLWKVMKGL